MTRTPREPSTGASADGAPPSPVWASFLSPSIGASLCQSHGASGLPTVRLGARLLVRRVDLAAIVGLDPTG